MKKVICSILIFAFIQASWAQEAIQSPELIHQDVELKLRLLNTMIRTEAKLEFVLGQLEAQGLSPEKFDAAWEQSFAEITQDYVQTQSRLGGLSQHDQGILSKFLKNFHWRELSRLHLKIWRNLKNTTRSKGLGLAGALVLGNILNWVVPYTLTLLGQPYLAAIVFAAPVNPPSILLHHAITSVLLERKMRVLLGSKAALNEYRALDRRVLEALSLEKKGDYFTLVELPEGKIFSARAQSFLGSIRQIFGLSSKQLNSAEIKRFLKKEQVDDLIVMGLLNDPLLSEEVKVSMVIQELTKFEHGALFQSFKLHFADFLVQRPLRRVSTQSLESWARTFTSAKSQQDIYTAIMRSPIDVHPYHLLTTWEQIILPELVRRDIIEYAQMRRLVSSFLAFKVQKEMALEDLTSHQTINDLGQYFRVSMGNGRNQCFRTQQEVIKSLLAH